MIEKSTFKAGFFHRSPCMKRLVLSSFATAVFLLSACGDTVENINQTGMEVVSEAKDLPKCTDGNEGDIAFVKKDNSMRACVDGEWIASTSEGSSPADFSCKTEELKDKSGLKIVCNGDSIGVVLNGSDGKEGKPGEKGADGKDGEDGEDGKDAVLPQDTLEADSERVAISLDSLVGFTQKGPFLKGSTVYLYELSDGRTLKQTNGNFTSNITQDNGRYKFLARDLVSQYAMVVVDGYYRNEVTGVSSNAPIRLKAITDMRKRNSVNVNILTHLEFERVYHLVTRGDSTGKKLTVKQAKRQAQREIMDIFNIKLEKDTDAEDMDVFGAKEADAALLAISILLQGDRTESEMMALLAEISTDIAEDGLWNDSTTGNAAKTKAQIADWAFTRDLSKFRKNVEGWHLGGSVGNFELFINNFIAQNYGINTCNQTDPTKQTVQNEYSKFNGKQYECYSWPENELGTWAVRRHNPYLNDTVTYGEMIDWRNRYMYHTVRIVATPYLQAQVAEDVKTDFTVMAENLDFVYEVDGQSYGNKCGDDDCEIYGRYYLWSAAMDSAGIFSTGGLGCGACKTCSMTEPVRGICPEGWHIPSALEYTDFYTVSSTMYGNSGLMAVGFEKWPNATNRSGFSALPAGYYYGDVAVGVGTFNAMKSIDSTAIFWSAAELNLQSSLLVELYKDGFWDSDHNKGFNKMNAVTVRCFKDYE